MYQKVYEREEGGTKRDGPEKDRAVFKTAAEREGDDPGAVCGNDGRLGKDGFPMVNRVEYAGSGYSDSDRGLL